MGEGLIVFIIILGMGIVIGGMVGSGIGYINGREDTRIEAINNGVAHYEITNKTQKAFVWNTVTNMVE